MSNSQRTAALLAVFTFLVGGLGATQLVLSTRAPSALADEEINDGSAVQYLASLLRSTVRRRPKPVTKASVSTTRQMVAVMIENSADARPVIKGIEKAKMVGEFTVEGGITRLVALFDRADFPDVVGPVRSMRLYFAQSFLPYSSAMLFAGWSPDAEAFIAKTVQPLFFNGLQYGNNFYRDTTIPEPHNYFTNRQKVEDLLAKQTLRSVTWPAFTTPERTLTGSAATTIDVNFYAQRSNEQYVYQPTSDSYTHTTGHDIGASHPSTFIVLEVPVTATGEKGRMTMDLLHGGKLLYFRHGKAITGTWSKPSIEQVFTFADNTGAPLPMGDGQIWILALPDVGRVSWK